MRVVAGGRRSTDPPSEALAPAATPTEADSQASGKGLLLLPSMLFLLGSLAGGAGAALCLR